jgi:sulfate adenylyltransferase
MISPYGGALVNLVVAEPAERADLYRRAASAIPIRLSPRATCDLELLAVGGFSPLTTFMGVADYRSVLQRMRLANGTLYPVPITLPVPDTVHLRPRDVLALEDGSGVLLGLLTVDEVFRSDRVEEAHAVCGTTDARHPLVAEMASWPSRSVSGPLRVAALPRHQGFAGLVRTPADARAALTALGHDRVVAFQTRNPMHRVHEELTKRAASRVGGALLIHPVVGQTKPGDVATRTRVLCYRALVERYYDPSRTLLSLLPLAMRMAGPREALWHATIRRNYGATHLIVGRDHAGAGLDSSGRPFHPPDAAHALVREHEADTGVAAVGFEELVYVPDERRYVERTSALGRRVIAISGTEVRERYLAGRRPLPEWLTRPEVAALLSAGGRHPAAGFCVWLMGLSGAGKSTIAALLASSLRERGCRATILDGDSLRSTVSKDLGFGRKDRETNVLRIGALAADLVRQGEAVIGAVITPYAAPRRRLRDMIGEDRFVLVHVDAPIDVCERRDVKGLYARARRGELTGFTGLDDPFEVPVDADVRVDTTACRPEDAVAGILAYLVGAGLLPTSTCPGDVPSGDAVLR